MVFPSFAGILGVWLGRIIVFFFFPCLFPKKDQDSVNILVLLCSAASLNADRSLDAELSKHSDIIRQPSCRQLCRVCIGSRKTHKNLAHQLSPVTPVTGLPGRAPCAGLWAHVQKEIDSEGIRTPAGRSRWISGPSP